MIATYCPRCGKPLLPDATRCPFCGQEVFVAGPPQEGPPPAPPQAGWGVPQPDQGQDKTMAIVGCVIVGVLLVLILPLLAAILILPSLFDQFRDLATFPPGFPDDFPFPSFPP